MSSYRQIHTKIWKDPWFLDLTPDQKLLFIYLFSNEQANLMGLYPLPLKVICFETDLDSDIVEAALAQFEADGKVCYEDNYVWIVNLFRYNANNLTSPKTKEHILKTLDEIPNIPLKERMIGYYREKGILDGYNTPYIQDSQEQEQEQEQEQDESSESAGADSRQIPAADYLEIRQAWIELFPNKPKPRVGNNTLQRKVVTRMKSTHFKQNWRAAMERAAKSKFCNEGPWFNLAWFLQNDDHYERCLQGNYDNRGGGNGANKRGSDQVVIQGHVPRAATHEEFYGPG